jgi:putative PEP-CTERM system TPR-repeat lipoprotein
MIKIQRICRLFVAIALLPAAAWVFSGCSLSPQAKEAAYLNRGKALAQKGDYRRALLEYQNAVNLAPRDAEPYYQIGLAYQALSRPREAYLSFKKATDLNPQHTSAQVRLIDLAAVAGSQELVVDAEARAKTLVSSAPDNTEALHALAAAEFRLGKSEDAEQHLRLALEKMPHSLQSSVDLAVIRMRRNDYGGAEEVLKKLAGQARDQLEPVQALAWFYSVNGRWPEAEMQFRRIVQLDPKNGQALRQLAELQLRTGRLEEAEETCRQLSQLPNKEDKPAHAVFLLNQGKVDAAISEFVSLAKQDPKDTGARRRLAFAYLAATRLADAEQVLSSILKENPNDVGALFYRAQIGLSTRKYAEAEADLNTIIHFDSTSATVHMLLARVDRARGSQLRQRQELSEAMRLRPDLLIARTEFANALTEAGSYTQALDVLNAAPAAQKNSVPLLLARNSALLAAGSIAEARRSIDHGLALAATQPEFLLQDARLKLKQKDYSGARTSLEKILGQNPENIEALAELTKSYSAVNQLPLGIQEIRRFVTQRPNSTALQMVLGAWLLRGGDRAQARAVFAAIKTAHPDFHDAYLALAQVDFTDGKLDAARQNLLSVIASNPRNAMALQALGQVEQQSGHADEAIKWLRKALDIDSQDAQSLNSLAYLLLDRPEQLDEALNYAQKALELAPTDPNIEDTLGWVFYRKGHYQMALQHLEKAASKSNLPVIKYHVAMAYFKMRDWVRGGTHFQTAVKMAPNLPEAIEAMALLSKRTAQ